MTEVQLVRIAARIEGTRLLVVKAEVRGGAFNIRKRVYLTPDE